MLETAADFFRYIGLGETQVLVYKEDFFNGQPKRQMVKISPAFLQCLIDTGCYHA